MLKKYMSKLSDSDLDNNNELDTNLLSHIINSQNDKHNLNGLINNVDDLNNLNNLFSLLNKLVNHSPNQQNNLNNHSNGSDNSANFLNFKTLSHSNSSSTNQFNYQQSLSVDQNALRKKSADISNLLDLIQNTQNNLKSQSISKSRSSNNLNQLNNQVNLLNLINNHNQNSQKISSQNHNQKLKRNDSEHITIDEDDLDKDDKKTKGPALKLVSLFQQSFNNSQINGYENCNYAYNSGVANHNPAANDRPNEAIQKLKDQMNLYSSPKALGNCGKSESFLNSNYPIGFHYNLDQNLNSNQTQSSSNLIHTDNYLNSNLKSKSDWNLTRKRIL